jgi:glutaredoxin 3
MQAEIYTKADCQYCKKAKELFLEKDISYQEFIISPGFDEDPAGPNQQYVTKAALLERAPNAKTVPQIWLEGNYIGGYTELAAFFNKVGR